MENKQKYHVIVCLVMFAAGYIAYRPDILYPYAVGDALVALTMARCVFLLYAMHLFLKLCRSLLGIDKK